jgi:cell division protein FtsW
MARKLKSDKLLFMATLLLVLASVVMVYSASAAMAELRWGNPYLFLTKQALWAALGIALMSLVMRIDYRVWRQPVFIWAGIAVAFVALVAVLFSTPINGTRRWFAVGGFGIQPSELAKLAVVFFTAALLERRMHQVNDLKETLLPLGGIVGVLTVLIVLEPDFGTSVCLVVTAGLMLFAAGLSWRYVAITAGAGVAAGAALIVISPYRIKRVLSFLSPEDDPRGAGFQLLQSLIAVGNGGIHGQGLMGGVQKLFYLPEPHTDRGAGAHRRDADAGGVRGDHLAWSARGGARARPVRRVSGHRPHRHAGGAGARQHERGAGADAHQGHPAAVCQRRRVVAAHQPREHGRAAERLAARLGGA